MRRAIASVLLFLISFPLIAAAFRVDDRPVLKACCRRDGKHHCDMADMDQSSDGPAVVAAKCASWPAQAIAVNGHQAASAPESHSAGPILRSALASVQPQAAPFIAIVKTPASKRGPPALLN